MSGKFLPQISQINWILDDEYDEEHDAFDDDANDVQIGEAYAPYDQKSSRQDFSHVV